jgi:hypothetical protein
LHFNGLNTAPEFHTVTAAMAFYLTMQTYRLACYNTNDEAVKQWTVTFSD